MTTVYVRRGSPEEPTYTCEKVMVRGVIEDKCGRCGVGSVKPIIGSICFMCNAMVVELDRSSGRISDGK